MQNPESSMAESPKRVQSAYNADKFMSEERFSGLQARRLNAVFLLEY